MDSRNRKRSTLEGKSVRCTHGGTCPPKSPKSAYGPNSFCFRSFGSFANGDFCNEIIMVDTLTLATGIPLINCSKTPAANVSNRIMQQPQHYRAIN